MKYPLAKRLSSVAYVVLFIVLVSQVNASETDTIYLGGDILTMNTDRPTVEAVGVRGSKIVSIGTVENVAEAMAKDARIVDLDGKTLMPSFFDPHGHLMLTAMLFASADLNAPPIGTVDSLEKLKQSLRDYATKYKLKPGDWIVGMNYDDTGIKEQRHPTREDLDQVSTTNPIYIMHSSSHFGVANSKALELAGINKDSKDPKAGEYRRDSNGVPDGVLIENPAFLTVMTKIKLPDAEVASKFFTTLLIEQYAAKGITTVQETGGAFPEFINLMKLMGANKQLPVDIIAYPTVNLTGLLSNYAEEKYYINNFRYGGLKVVLDGSIQGYTAFLGSPYFVAPDHVDKDSGFVAKPNYSQHELDQIVANALAKGWHLLVHCNGDGSIDMLITSMRKALAANPLKDHRTTIIHAQAIRQDQLAQVKELGVGVSLFPGHIYYWGDRHLNRFLGPERAAYLNPMQSVAKQGIPYTIHVDSPVTPTSLLDAVAFSVNRVTIGGVPLGKQQELSVDQALRAITINAARQHGEDQRKGSLEQGKLADMVVLSDNPLKIGKNNIRDIQVLQTIKNGEVIYLKTNAF